MQKVIAESENNTQNSVRRLVMMSLKFHNLNKLVEQRLGISLVQYHFLNTLRDMPATSPLLLARAVGMHPSTLTQSTKRLSKRGLIFVGEDLKDSRKKILSLTSKGNKALGLFESQIDDLLNIVDREIKASGTRPKERRHSPGLIGRF